MKFPVRRRDTLTKANVLATLREQPAIDTPVLLIERLCPQSLFRGTKYRTSVIDRAVRLMTGLSWKKPKNDEKAS